MSPAEDVVEDERAKRRRFRRSDFLGNTDVFGFGGVGLPEVLANITGMG